MDRLKKADVIMDIIKILDDTKISDRYYEICARRIFELVIIPCMDYEANLWQNLITASGDEVPDDDKFN